MARLVGIIANRPDLTNRLAEHQREVLCSHNHDEEPWGWGVGFFQSGEILLKRRPLDERVDLSLEEMISDVRSDIMLAHIRRATVGALCTDNTHPFRYRQWMFADTGTVDGFGDLRGRLYDTLPQFLQRNLRGDTDSELLFHVFLSFLHDAGKLDQHVVAPRDVFPALKSSLALLRRVSRDADLPESALNILLTAPDYLIAAHGGPAMAYRILKGRADFEPLFQTEGPASLRLPDLEPCRMAVVASDFDAGIPAGWTEVPDKAMIAFTRTAEATIVEPQ